MARSHTYNEDMRIIAQMGLRTDAKIATMLKNRTAVWVRNRREFLSSLYCQFVLKNHRKMTPADLEKWHKNPN